MDTCDSTNSRYLSVYLVLLTIFQQAHEDLIRILSSTMVVRCSALSTARSSCSLVTTVAAPPSLSAPHGPSQREDDARFLWAPSPKYTFVRGRARRDCW